MENGNQSKKRISTSSLPLPHPKKRMLLDIGLHPYGIQPWGNFYMKGPSSIDGVADRRQQGLGPMSVLEDQQLIEQILIFFTASDLVTLSQVSKACYIYAHYSDLWRELVMDYFGGDWTYRDSWKQTYIDAHVNRMVSTGKSVLPYLHHKPLVVDAFFSDMLYDEWQSSVVNLKFWAERCPDNIDRRAGLSVAEFDAEYGFPNKPVILTDQVPTWPAWTKWNKKDLMTRFAGKTFQVGRVEQTLDKYFTYCEQIQEEKPLYLFDNLYGEKYPDLLEDYVVPLYFRQDYFALLGKKDRPSYRWLLMGPPRSGSTFHKDPNSTSAWNGLISGLKLWIMYPPDCPPPAVYPSKDESEVTTPVSVLEWMLKFHQETSRGNVKPIQCLQRPGDLIFIPNGWWHQVLNIEECIAVTQNVVCDANLTNVVKFLKAKKRPDVWLALQAALKEHHPDKLARVEEEIAQTKRNFQVDAPPASTEIEKGGSFWQPNNFTFGKKATQNAS